MHIEKLELLIFTVNLFICLCFFFGMILLFGEDFQRLWDKARVLRRLKARQREYREERDIELWVRLAVKATFGNRLSPFVFICMLTSVVFGIFLIGIRTLSPASALAVAVLTGTMPCLLIGVRLVSMQKKSSFEGEILVSEFLRQYRMSNYNVFHCLERIVAGSFEAKITKGLLFQLLVSIRATGNARQIRKATDRFAYAVNTNWSRMLAHNIYLAAAKGINVSLAVEDILIQLREARVLAEERKRLNSEAMRMIFYMVPLLYIATTYTAVRYLNISLGTFVANQFQTTEGLLFFLLILFFFFGNLGLLMLVTNRKFDY